MARAPKKATVSQTQSVPAEQPPAVPSWAQRLFDRLSLPGFEAWSTNVRTVFLNVIFLVAIVVVVPVLISQFSRNEVIIEPIAVPEALLLQGMTPEVAASRVWDGLNDVAKASQSSRETIVALPGSRRVEFSFPDSGFSIESLVFHLRRLFGAYETRIAGEFTCADATCDRTGIRLRLRVVRDRVDVIDLPVMGKRDERKYLADAGSGVFSVLDPFVAIAAAADKEPAKATTLARRLIRSRHADAKWAHNLIGLIRLNDGDLPAAITEFRAAIALDPEFLPARANLGNALRVSGDLDGARAEFTELLELDPNSVIGVEGFSDLALATGKADEAVKLLAQAAELDPVNPRYPTKAGWILINLGRKAEGLDLVQRAFELDPGYEMALSLLGQTYFIDEDYQSAERFYRQAADYEPESAEAQAEHANVLAILHKWDEAIERYRRSTVLAPGNSGYWLELGRCLQRVDDAAESLRVLEIAVGLAPKDAEIHLALGNALRDLDRKAEAVAAYRKFLALDNTDSPMRPIAQRWIELLSG